MKKYAVLIVAAAIIAVHSCRKQADTLTTTAYLDLPATPDDYYSAGLGGGVTAAQFNLKARLGRVLFYDTHLSANNTISCGSCHKQVLGFSDNTAFSRGFEGRLTGRNSPGFNRLSSAGSLFWDGRENSLDNLIARPISNHVEMGIDDLAVLPAKLSALPYYNALFTAAYGDSVITLQRLSSAVSTFLQSVGTKSTTLLQRTLSPLEQQGNDLFCNKYNCTNCHSTGGSYYGDNFIDIGLDEVYTDKGMGAISRNPKTDGMFKVPNLTNVGVTAPYMHDGRYKTLDEVLEHYSHGIKNSKNLSPKLQDSTGNARQMNISDNEKKAIIAFLNTFTDDQTNTDPKFSNPFKAK